MILKEVHTKSDFCDFYKIPEKIYEANPFYRNSESELTRMLVEGPSAFHHHVEIHSFLIFKDAVAAGRFSLIRDQKLPEYVQVSFFEALPGLHGVAALIIEKVRAGFPDCKRVVIGLNGHLNYGAGILTGNFNEPPVFGLPYNREYYPEYFPDFNRIPMVSFRFPFEPFIGYRQRMGENPDFKGITVRKLNKRKLRQDIEIYTYLNNASFADHPYWAERTAEEDFELFYPFRFLIKEENLLFAEKDGKPIGFFLWYPDFNQLVKGSRQLGLVHLLKYYLTRSIDTFRFTEIAVLPEYKLSYAVPAMFWHAIPCIRRSGVKFGEGGFIFEANSNSILMTRRFIERASGIKMEPYRQYSLFETTL